MFRPLALSIGLRYTRAKRRNHFISFISLSSMIGIALGVMVLIAVLSVMNGFDYEIRQRVFSMASHVHATRFSAPIEHWERLGERFLRYPEVRAVAPFVAGQGMLTSGGTVRPVFVTGIDIDAETKVSTLASMMSEGKVTDLQQPFSMIVGQELALNLGLGLEIKWF